MSWFTRAMAAQRPGLLEPPLAVESVADRFIESYVCWREACEDVGSAYEGWARYETAEGGLGFESYLAALDREEHAADVHSDWAERLRRGLKPKPNRPS
jgi:hypothetical protein